jgi:hypothetical protein
LCGTLERVCLFKYVCAAMDCYIISPSSVIEIILFSPGIRAPSIAAVYLYQLESPRY